MSKPVPRAGGPTSRRSFTAAEKLDHIAAYEAAMQKGDGGAYLRADGLYARALSGAFNDALTNQADDLPPPARVVSLVEVAPEVRKAVAAASFGSPQLIEAGSLTEAEDVFDSLVGHMAGRVQPTEPPSTEDWSLLIGHALSYLRAEPWVRWSDVVPLRLQLTVDETVANYVAIVMGNAGVQRGLALYPG